MHNTNVSQLAPLFYYTMKLHIHRVSATNQSITPEMSSFCGFLFGLQPRSAVVITNPPPSTQAGMFSVEFNPRPRFCAGIKKKGAMVHIMDG